MTSALPGSPAVAAPARSAGSAVMSTWRNSTRSPNGASRCRARSSMTSEASVQTPRAEGKCSRNTARKSPGPLPMSTIVPGARLSSPTITAAISRGNSSRFL